MGCGGPIFEIVRDPGWAKRFGETTQEDTIHFARRLLREELDLLVFVGGDGTAVDVARAVDGRVPILGVPAGVKMFSGVFAETSTIARNLVKDLNRGFETAAVEVIDLDESSYQAGEWHVRALAHARVPVAPGVQVSKGGTIPTEDESEADVVAWFKESFDPATTYVLAAGTTVGAIKRHLGGGSPLGVDVFQQGSFVATDASEARILEALEGADKIRLIRAPRRARVHCLAAARPRSAPRSSSASDSSTSRSSRRPESSWA
jgi:predicted polyphosphate/ATP-dependent NAD kinase